MGAEGTRQGEHRECGSAHGRGDPAPPCVACPGSSGREQETGDHQEEARQGQGEGGLRGNGDTEKEETLQEEG